MARPIVKRRQIEEGVVRVVASKGLHAATIQDIASASQVSAGLLYRYWENRDALAGEVYRGHYEAAVARVGARVAAQSDFWKRVRALIDAFLEFADEQPTILRFLLLSQHDLAPSIPHERSIHGWLEALIREGQAQRCVREMPPPLAVQFMVGLILQPVIGSIYGRVADSGQALSPHIFEAVQRALGTAGALQ